MAFPLAGCVKLDSSIAVYRHITQEKFYVQNFDTLTLLWPTFSLSRSVFPAAFKAKTNSQNRFLPGRIHLLLVDIREERRAASVELRRPPLAGTLIVLKLLTHKHVVGIYSVLPDARNNILMIVMAAKIRFVSDIPLFAMSSMGPSDQTKCFKVLSSVRKEDFSFNCLKTKGKKKSCLLFQEKNHSRMMKHIDAWRSWAKYLSLPACLKGPELRNRAIFTESV